MEVINIWNEGKKIKEIINNTGIDEKHICKNNNFIIIGSGLSYVIAEYLSFFLVKLARLNATVCTPLEYMVMKPLGTPIIISYRGKNRDITGVANCIINSCCSDCIMITGFKHNSCYKILNSKGVNVIGVYLPPHVDERRFVSLRSTISLIGASWQFCEMLLGDHLSKISDDDIFNIINMGEKQAEKIVEEISHIQNYQSKKWYVLGIGINDPLSRLIQTCFAEAGLMSVQICDYRDYLHGKYLATFEESNNGFIMIKYPQCESIIKIIRQRFRSYFSLIEFNSSRQTLSETMTEILTVFLVAEKMLVEKGFSLRMPPKPKEMRNWTSWGELRV